jgi:hypothetical protein
MKIEQFNKKYCQMLGSAVEEALQQVGKNFGVNIRRTGGTFSSTNFTIKIEASVIGEDGNTLTRDAEIFKMYCHQYNLEPTDLGATFTASDQTVYKITGMKARSGKFPILAISLTNGKTYGLPASMVQRGLGRKIDVIPFLNPRGDKIPM